MGRVPSLFERDLATALPLFRGGGVKAAKQQELIEGRNDDQERRPELTKPFRRNTY